jgi:protein-tyrosine kinase
MTRLSDALDRANDFNPAAVRNDAPPAPWDFGDADEEVLQPARPLAEAPRHVTEAPRPVTELPRVAETPRAMAEPFRALETRFPEADRQKVVVGKDTDSAVIEQYRRLAAGLHHAQREQGARSVMVASAVPAEGKTLTSSNLALTLSESYQRRVLLIDADLRRPSIHTMFDLPNEVGLVDSLTLPIQSRLPVQAVSPTLWILTAGRPSTDPMGVLVSEAMKELLAQATEAFDWVVVDTPPVAFLSDANLLAGMIDTALLVVGARSTPYPMAQRAIQAIGASKILGVVLNRAEQEDLSDGYGHYGTRQDHAPAQPKPARKRWFQKRAS